MSLAVEPLGTSAAAIAEWDEFVRSSAGWTPFHLARWRDVLADVHGHTSAYLCARDEGGRLHGVLPLVHVASPLFGRFLVSMPFVNYGGPLGTPESVAALASAAAALATEHGDALLELRSRHEQPLDLPVSHRKITCVLDLPADEPARLFRSLDANVRRRVRRADKAGIATELGPDQLAAFYKVYARHMRDLGTPAQPLELFARLLAAFPEEMFFVAAYLGREPVAVLAGFIWDDELEVTWASALIAHKELAANMRVYWSAIEHAMARGLRRFNFGRCTPNGGTHRFKRQWGARDEPLWWYARANGGRTATPSPSDPAYAWGPRLWKRMPERLATALGRRLVRYIP